MRARRARHSPRRRTGPRGLRVRRAASPRSTGRSSSTSVLLAVEPVLAAHVVARATKRDVAGATVRTPPPSSVAGAFAAVVDAALRRAHAGSHLRVATVGSSTDLASSMATDPCEFVVARLTVVFGDAAFEARIAAARAALARPRRAPWTRTTLSSLGPVRSAVPVVACCASCSAALLADTRCGDALVMPTWPLKRLEGHFTGGPVWLASPSTELGLRARFDDSGNLVLGKELDPLDGPASSMSTDESDALVATVGDALVSIRVELASAVMAARDWAALGPGAIVTLGQRVGEAVVIRVGGAPVARGELIDVDGEVAVRILERLSDLVGP